MISSRERLNPLTSFEDGLGALFEELVLLVEEYVLGANPYFDASCSAYSCCLVCRGLLLFVGVVVEELVLFIFFTVLTVSSAAAQLQPSAY